MAMKPVVSQVKGKLEYRMREHCEMFRRCHTTLAKMFELVEKYKKVEGNRTIRYYGKLHDGNMTLEVDMGEVHFGVMIDEPAFGPHVYVEKEVDDPKSIVGCRTKGGKYSDWEDAVAFVVMALTAEIGPTEAAEKVERCMRLTLENESRHFQWWPVTDVLFNLSS
jgi:hypothetical protein